VEGTGGTQSVRAMRGRFSNEAMSLSRTARSSDVRSGPGTLAIVLQVLQANVSAPKVSHCNVSPVQSSHAHTYCTKHTNPQVSTCSPITDSRSPISHSHSRSQHSPKLFSHHPLSSRLHASYLPSPTKNSSSRFRSSENSPVCFPSCPVRRCPWRHSPPAHPRFPPPQAQENATS
jgi:hypothetical protein